jgi:hypothetical protein
MNMNIENAVVTLQNHIRSGNAALLQSECFVPDAMISGEGAPGIARGEENIKTVLEHVVRETPDIAISIVALQPISESTAVTWLQWTSPEADGSGNFRSLTVWVKSDGQWKILADMYGMGQFQD